MNYCHLNTMMEYYNAADGEYTLIRKRPESPYYNIVCGVPDWNKLDKLLLVATRHLYLALKHFNQNKFIQVQLIKDGDFCNVDHPMFRNEYEYINTDERCDTMVEYEIEPEPLINGAWYSVIIDDIGEFEYIVVECREEIVDGEMKIYFHHGLSRYEPNEIVELIGIVHGVEFGEHNERL